jgi:hypothetical protein
MSRENVEIVRGVYDAVARRDTERVLDLYDPNVVWDMSRGAFGDLEGGGVAPGTMGSGRGFTSSTRCGRDGTTTPTS